jgi:hypothetical protein
MKLVSIVLVVSACYAGGAPPPPQMAPISLFMQNQNAPPEVLEALQAEVASILAPAGFRFEWYELSAAKMAGTSVELAVVTFQGRCDTNTLLRFPAMPIKPLGFTSVTDGEILPFTTVDCDGTRNFLAATLMRFPASERPAAFGRALGRVLAHELYHIFAKTQHHGRTGVAKEAYTVFDLMADEFELEEEQFELLRSSPAYNALIQSSTH